MKFNFGNDDNGGDNGGSKPAEPAEPANKAKPTYANFTELLAARLVEHGMSVDDVQIIGLVTETAGEQVEAPKLPPAVERKPAAKLQLRPAATPADKKPSPLLAKLQAKHKAPARDEPIKLRGTGLTKRLGEQLQRAADKAEAPPPVEHTDEEREQIIETARKEHLTFIEAHKLPSQIRSDVELDESQLQAVDGLSRQMYGCLIGAAGTGKTTTVRELVARMVGNLREIDLNRARKENMRTTRPEIMPAMCFVSFTGKGVQQIKRNLPKEYHALCDTGHGTLGYTAVYEERYNHKTKETRMVRVFVPTFTAANKLPYQICFIDEAGMMPNWLFNQIVEALPDDCRIILIGDINQLQPVQGRSVLVFAMQHWPTYELQKIWRTDEGGIIDNAHRILHGLRPRPDGKTFFMKKISNRPTDAFKEIYNLVRAMSKRDRFDPMHDALISGTNVNTLGQLELNHHLVDLFNPVRKVQGVPINERVYIHAGREKKVFAVGDKVMLLSNLRTRKLTNGQMGVVTNIVRNGQYKGTMAADMAMEQIANMEDFDLSELAIDEIADVSQDQHEEEEEELERQASHIMEVIFQGQDAELQFQAAGDFTAVAHAYAMTCHKMQGSEGRNIIVICHSSQAVMLSREWLYTGVTRAQDRVYLLYNERGLTKALARQEIKGKTLAEKAASIMALQDKNDSLLPILYAPREVES